jgi:hypothetical protein
MPGKFDPLVAMSATALEEIRLNGVNQGRRSYWSNQLVLDRLALVLVNWRGGGRYDRRREYARL